MQGIIEIMNCGVRAASRALLLYRAAHYTRNNYLDLLSTQNVCDLLLKVSTVKNSPKKIDMIYDLMIVNAMSSEEISEFLATEMFKAISMSRFGIDESTDMNDRAKILVPEYQSDKMWGFCLDNDFHLFLELTENSSLLGDFLLVFFDLFDYYTGKYYSSQCAQMAEKIQANVYNLYPKLDAINKKNLMRVELLIKAHECYTKDCLLEGIGKCLEKARDLITILTKTKSFNFIVRLLYGIGRYREMYYCFDILIKFDQFELLLGQFGDKYSDNLRRSLLTYLNEYHPENKDFYNMTIFHFRMHYEIAQKWENEAMAMKDELIREEIFLPAPTDASLSMPYLPSDKDTFDVLNKIMNNLAHSAESYLQDGRIELAQKVTYKAQLFALQISFVNKNLNSNNKLQRSPCMSIINIQNTDILKYLAERKLFILETLILQNAYNYEVDWKMALFYHVVKKGNMHYLNVFLDHKNLTKELIEGVALM